MGCFGSSCSFHRSSFSRNWANTGWDCAWRSAAAPRFSWTVLLRAAARGRARRLPRTAALSATRYLRAGCSRNFPRRAHPLRRRHRHEVLRQQIVFDFFLRFLFFCRAVARQSSSSHRAFVTRHALQLRNIDPVQHHGQLAGPQLHAAHSFLGSRQLEHAFLQPLVPQHKAVPIPHQNLQSVPAPRAKHKQMPAQRILPNHRLHPLRQPVKPAAHVRRFHRQPDARGLRPIERPQTRQPHHAASTTPTSTRTCSASQPPPPTKHRPLRNRISTRAGSDTLGSSALPANRDPFAASPPWRASCTSTNLPAPPRFAAIARARWPSLRPQPLLPPVKVRHAQPPLPAERRHTLRAPPLRANQPPPLRSRLPAPFSLRHCASLPAIRHSAPLHLAHTRCPSRIAHVEIHPFCRTGGASPSARFRVIFLGGLRRRRERT